MAIIYHFRNHRTPRLSSSPTQQAREVILELNNLNGMLNVIGLKFESIQEAQCSFSSQLDLHLLKLDKAQEFAHRCSEACELKSFEQMVKIRDQLIRDRRQNTIRQQRGAKLGLL